MKFNGFVLFVDDLATMRHFYGSLLHGVVVAEGDGFVTLRGGGVDLTLHLASSPDPDNTPREDVPLKSVWRVESVAARRDEVLSLGGSAVALEEAWRDGDELILNAVDPEGNVLSLVGPA